MNCTIKAMLAVVSLLGFSTFSTGCVLGAMNVSDDTATDTSEPEDTAAASTPSDLDHDGVTDSSEYDYVVPSGNYVYVSKGVPASLTNDYLVGHGKGGTETENDYCSETSPQESYMGQVDWPVALSGKVRYFLSNSVSDFFGDTRTWSDTCSLVTDGGLDEWGDLSDAYYAGDPAICPNPADGNRLGIRVMNAGDGLFAPGCDGASYAPDTNRDTGGTVEDTDTDTDSGNVDTDTGVDADGCAEGTSKFSGTFTAPSGATSLVISGQIIASTGAINTWQAWTTDNPVGMTVTTSGTTATITWGCVSDASSGGISASYTLSGGTHFDCEAGTFSGHGTWDMTMGDESIIMSPSGTSGCNAVW